MALLNEIVAYNTHMHGRLEKLSEDLQSKMSTMDSAIQAHNRALAIIAHNDGGSQGSYGTNSATAENAIQDVADLFNDFLQEFQTLNTQIGALLTS